MGAIFFSLDATLARLLQRELSCDVFFESGGFEGDTIAVVKELFDRVVSVELAPTYAQGLRTRFLEEKNVEIVEGDSAATLEKMNAALRDSRVLYWLDAHWCDANAVDAAIHQCPLLRELRALGNLNEHSAVVIDDARLFLAPPLAPHEVTDWPTWTQISKLIEANSGSTHEVMVVNDCIVIFPRAMQGAMAEYAQTRGADWLKIADLSREHGTILKAAEDRLRLINELHEGAANTNNAIAELRRSESQTISANDALTVGFNAIRSDLEAKEVALIKTHQSVATLLAENRLLTPSIQILQAELEAKESVIQSLITASNQASKQIRVLVAELEIAKAGLLGKEDVIFSIEQRRLEQEQLLASATAKFAALDREHATLRGAALFREIELSAVRADLQERDESIQVVRAQSTQLRDEDVGRRKSAARQISTLEHELHEARANVAALQANSAVHASLLAVAASAFGGSSAINAVSLESNALALSTASAAPWQTQAVEKEAVITELAAALDALRTHTPFRTRLASVQKRGLAVLHGILTPKLGVLYQHSPVSFGGYKVVGGRSLPDGQYPRISIVTPSFKQGRLIERTIKSVLDQNYPSLEYFIQDGGSTDETVDVLGRYESQIAGWESKPDGGQSAAINMGFKRTSGEIMAWLNSDDLLMPGALKFVAEYFHRYPKVDVVYGDRLLIDENDALIGRWVLPGHNAAVLPWADYVPQETLFWRRSLWERVGGEIDESFKFAMDWDLLLRFRSAGAKFAHLPHYLGAFRIHSQQKTTAAIAEIGFAEMKRLRLREFGREVTDREIRRAIAPFMARHLLADKLRGSLKPYLLQKVLNA